MNEMWRKYNATGPITPFNHGYLCQMLASASRGQLAQVIKDVEKYQKKFDAEKEKHAQAITDAVSAAIKDGYIVSFRDKNEILPFCTIDKHDWAPVEVELKYKGD